MITSSLVSVAKDRIYLYLYTVGTVKSDCVNVGVSLYCFILMILCLSDLHYTGICKKLHSMFVFCKPIVYFIPYRIFEVCYAV